MAGMRLHVVSSEIVARVPRAAQQLPESVGAVKPGAAPGGRWAEHIKPPPLPHNELQKKVCYSEKLASTNTRLLENNRE
jgi:hypothetical protein